MSNIRKYKPTDKMSHLITRNYSLISAMSRFGLPLGFGEKSVQDFCKEKGVDCNTFLAVVNFIEQEQYGSEYDQNAETLSVESLVNYLKQAHSFFLDFCLPNIRTRLCQALDQEPEKNDVTESILMFYDKYVEEVRRHMEYENKYVFKYVEQLIEKKATGDYTIKCFAEKHNHIEQKLRELKNIIIKYYPQNSCNNLLNATLFDILNCEQDLDLHCKLEDQLFTPAVVKLENEVSK